MANAIHRILLSSLLANYQLVLWTEIERSWSHMQISGRLKSIRQSMGISQRELAELCGCSSSFISQIELRQTSPSLASLGRICEGLGMNVVQFLSKKAEDIDALVVREQAPRQFLCNWESATIEFLMPAEAAAALTVLRLRVQPKGKTALRRARRSMHEIGHIVKGRGVLHLAKKSVRLAAGDTVRLDLSTPHQWTNPGDSILEVILINPNFTDVFDMSPATGDEEPRKK